MDHWRGGDRGEEVTMVPVIMQGFQIYQPPGGGACWGVPLYLVDMIERDPAEHIGVADRVGSIEAGKDADIVFCRGDVMDVSGDVVRVLIEGRDVDMSGKGEE